MAKDTVASPLDKVKAMEGIVKALSDLTPDLQVQIQVIELVKSTLRSESPSTSSLAPPLDPTTESPDNEIKPFFLRKNPKTHHQKFAVLAYYLHHLDKKEEYTSNDLRKVWGKSGDPPPSMASFRVSLNDTITKYRYLMIPGKRGIYSISNRGQDLVKSLPNPPKNLLGVEKKQGRRTKKRKS